MDRTKDWSWTDADTIIPLFFVTLLLATLCGFAYDTYVLYPERKKAHQEDVRAKKAECVRRGGKVTEYNGGSVWSTDWACEGATKFD